jgi:hypothetical protein
MKKNSQEIREEIADEVFHNIPPDKERKKMSSRELAKLLSECQKGSPAYILFEHELNIRLVNMQIKPVYYGLGVTIIGIIVLFFSQ